MEERFVILAPSQVCELIAPVDPDNLAHLTQGVYRARWVNGTVPEDELATMRLSPRILITMDRTLSKAEGDTVDGHEMLFKVRETVNWIPTWLAIGNADHWIKQAWDPPFTETSFAECKTVDELIEKFDHGNWSLGVAFYFGDICFIQRVNGGDEWLVIKQDCDFESFTTRPMIQDTVYPFKRLIEDIQRASTEACRKLNYTDKWSLRDPAVAS